MRFLRRIFAAWRHDSIRLGVPVAINSDVTIQFRGEGLARFRLQHACDDSGVPDELSWCDVSAICNRNIPADRVVFKDDSEVRGETVRGWMVGEINGNFETTYRRHKARWLRVIPSEDDNEEERTRCQAYSISIHRVAA